MRTVSLRIDDKQIAGIEKVKQFLPTSDTSFVYRYVLEKGLKEILLEKAISEYVAGRASTGRAAEIAGLDWEEMNLELAKRGIEMHYGEKELKEDLEIDA